MKTGHAPDNLIPSAKPLSKELARQFLPDDLQGCLQTLRHKGIFIQNTLLSIGPLSFRLFVDYVKSGLVRLCYFGY